MEVGGSRLRNRTGREMDTETESEDEAETGEAGEKEKKEGDLDKRGMFSPLSNQSLRICHPGKQQSNPAANS